MERLENRSFNTPNNLGSDNKVLLGQVIGIEGDPSWNENKKLIIDRSDNPEIEEKRMIDKGTGRIIVKIRNQGNYFVANPFFPRIFNVYPELNDTVKLIKYGDTTQTICIDYIGPVIPSMLNLNDSSGVIGLKNNDAVSNYLDDDTIIDFIGDDNNIKKIYPKINDISLQGRGSAELLISKILNQKTNTNESIMLRSGKFLDYNNLKPPTYNKKNAYIRVTTEPSPEINYKSGDFIGHIYEPKYDISLTTTPPQSNPIKTRVDIVGEKIYIFSHPQQKEAYSLIYAELLFQYLSQLQSWLINHKHGKNGTPAQSDEQKLGNNLTITNDGYIKLPESGSKIALTQNIKII